MTDEIDNRDQSLFGLLLAGGESRRMGKPKASILYKGVPLYLRGLKALEGVCKRSFISCRNDSLGVLFEQNYILDHYPSKGPMSGILSALQLHRTKSWLVIPVDMPRLTSDFLHSMLILKRRSDQDATVIRDISDGRLQPLVAIYEPSSFHHLCAAFECRNYGIRSVLSQMNVHYVDLEDPGSLLNINSPEDWPDSEIFE